MIYKTKEEFEQKLKESLNKELGLVSNVEILKYSPAEGLPGNSTFEIHVVFTCNVFIGKTDKEQMTPFPHHPMTGH